MATARESNDEDDKIKELGRKISELQLAKMETIEKARAVNEEMERIAMFEQECMH